jgi:hypothetical protein
MPSGMENAISWLWTQCVNRQGLFYMASGPISIRNTTANDAAAESWLVRHRRRLAEVSLGHGLYAVFNWFFDNVLYVYVVYQLGLLRGGTIMTLLSMVQCGALLMLYERMRIDWVGAGSIGRLSSIPNPVRWQRVLLWADRRGAAVVFLALCILQDPFITTVYFRRGRFNGLRPRDWRIFLASVLTSNGYWTLRSGALGVVLVGGWHWLLNR